MSKVVTPALVEPKALDRDRLMDAVGDPLTVLEKLFEAAGSGGIDAPSAAWFGLARMVKNIRRDLDEMVAQDTAFDDAQRRVTKGRAS